MSLEKQQKEWFEHLLRNRTEGTSKDYRRWAMKFEDWRDWTDVSVSDGILSQYDDFLNNPDQLEAFKEEYVDAESPWNMARWPESYAYRSRVVAVSAVKSYVDFVYGVEFGDREEHKVNHAVRGNPPDDFDPPVAEPDEVKEVFEDCWDCKSDSCYMMARVAYDAVMRGIEVTRVEWDDVDLGKGRIYVRSAKGSPNRWIALSDDVVDELESYRAFVKSEVQNPNYLFYKFFGYRPISRWSPGAWGGHFKRHFEPGFHCFARHSAITNRLNSGEGISKVNSRARHARMSNTQKYNNLVNNGDTLPEELQGGSRDYSSR